MQQVDAVGPVAFGVMGAAGSFQAYGTSGLAVALALIGAGLAASEIDPFKWRAAFGVLIFNLIVGVLGGALITALMQAEASGIFDHPLMLAGVSFGVAYFGHDAVQNLRPAVFKAAAKLLGGGKA
ncbi:hypothetical protein [Roseovarius sp. MMSF_3281]|uniref:hypothetical protein n=1 Tax=Roseovarius sp. MMSF_3281 TaxID=3046694 RepID=UPI002740133D|nr:hypothetical protein [Roseovarius sp. MMSF_3281]